MPRPPLEVATVFRQNGPAYRQAHSLPLHHRRLMQAIENCRTAVLGGHAKRCSRCGHTRASYNSCRNRHCPKCQGQARAAWVSKRADELLPVEYFHVVFTIPDSLAAIAFHNKERVYEILFRATAETLLTVARDRKHLGGEAGFFAVLHTWGQNLLHHPHLHCVIPGGVLAPDHDRWISCLPGFFLPVRVLSRLFRRLFSESLEKAFAAGQLRFSGELEGLREPEAFAAYLARTHETEWVVYAKPPFGGPQQVLQYLGRYTHRVAISNQRLVSSIDGRVAFRWHDYRHRQRSKILSLEAPEFIRRFLLHALPPGFQRIRHYGFLANCHRTRKMELCRQLLSRSVTSLLPGAAQCHVPYPAIACRPPGPCPQCGTGLMVIIEILLPCHGPVPAYPDSS